MKYVIFIWLQNKQIELMVYKLQSWLQVCVFLGFKNSFIEI